MDTHARSRELDERYAATGGAAGGEGLQLDVAVVGGGISGLATAYYALQESGTQGGPAPRVGVFEATGTLGGKVQTEVVDSGQATPFVVEAGPDSFLTQKPWALQLARSLGMEAELIGTNDHRRRVFVLQRNRLVMMPEGLQLIVPTRLTPFLRSPLLSPWGKLRMGLDLILPARRDDADETLADFVVRRLGREALDKLAEPLMSGIYSAEADRQSILATFPRFREMERTHGSLIRAIWAASRARRDAVPTGAAQRGTAQTGTPKPLAAFVTPVQGTAELIRRLADALGPHVQRNHPVTRIEAEVIASDSATEEGKRGRQGYRLRFADGSSVYARSLVLAVPAPAAARLLHEIAPGAARGLGTIRHVSTVTLTLAYAPGAVAHPMDGFGVMIPRSEQREINAITWTTSKFDHRAPEDHRLIRVFLGGSRNPEVVARDDADLLQLAQRELEAIMGVNAQPLFHRLFRWQDASPQYDVGHLDLVDAIEADLPPNLYVTGSPYRGIGIPDCVHQAQTTARRVLSALAGDALTEAAAAP